MKNLGEIITEEIFIESLKILKIFISKKDAYIQDINLILVSGYITNLSEKQVRRYYKKYVKTGLLYAIPEFYGTDRVSVPKGIASVREYRFFSSFGLILYNSLGILFSEMCSDVIENLKLKNRKIFSYAPTTYRKNNNNWTINNNWKDEYKKFKQKIAEETEHSDVVLHIDISNFFNSIKHDELINILNDYAKIQHKAKYNFSKVTSDILEYYLLSVMNKDCGLPQGRKNFASDYLAFLYMFKLDMHIENLVVNKKLEFVSAVRYVDDTYIFFRKADEQLSNRETFKQLSSVEHKINKWLYEQLGLMVNADKTRREILSTSNAKKDFLGSIEKSVSQSMKKKPSKTKIKKMFNEFKKALKTFKYSNNNNFNDDFFKHDTRESLKKIFSIKKYLLKKENISELEKILRDIDFDLSSSQFHILGLIFEKQKNKNPYVGILENYFKKEFNPKDKRQVHILIFLSMYFYKKKIFHAIVKNKENELLNDDYGKYLMIYYGGAKTCNYRTVKWTMDDRVFYRICQEYKLKNKNYPFLNAKYEHSFLKILLYKDKALTPSVIEGMSGYVHNFHFKKWNEALNRLQIVVHESTKMLLGIKEEKISGIINKLQKDINISTYEERDILLFWDRRNLNPNTHGSKNGIASPEVSKSELEKWEKKMIVLINKIYSK